MWLLLLLLLLLERNCSFTVHLTRSCIENLLSNVMIESMQYQTNGRTDGSFSRIIVKLVPETTKYGFKKKKKKWFVVCFNLIEIEHHRYRWFLFLYKNDILLFFFKGNLNNYPINVICLKIMTKSILLFLIDTLFI